MSLATAIVTLVVGTGTVAHASPPVLVANGTYVFEAGGAPTAFNDAFNGSTVTFPDNQLVGWDLSDALAAGDQPPLDFPLVFNTPGFTNNSVISGGNAAVIAANEWAYTIDSTISSNPAAFFEIGNNVSANGNGPGSVFDGVGDPNGTWSMVSAPDMTSTLGLLAGVLALLGISQIVSRKRAAARC